MSNFRADIPKGFYTLVYPNGEHRTICVKVPRDGFFKDRRIVGFLRGSDNTADYTFFGDIDGTGSFRFWSKFATAQSSERLARIRKALLVLAGDPEAAGKMYALKSGNCFNCGKLLTNPESVMSGLGPICSGREGGFRRAA